MFLKAEKNSEYILFNHLNYYSDIYFNFIDGGLWMSHVAVWLWVQVSDEAERGSVEVSGGEDSIDVVVLNLA